MSNPRHFFLGSLPFDNAGRAISFVKRYSDHLPFLPQLPRANKNEDMIQQMLCGFKSGRWDRNASICLAPFFSAFSKATKVKVQMGGPFTLARVLNRPLQDIVGDWLLLLRNLVEEFRGKGFKGQLWVQIDEPMWSEREPFPSAYDGFLGAAKLLDSKLLLGIHSCASHRPAFSSHLWSLCHFFSFDFLQSPLTGKEDDFLKTALQDEKFLIAGVYDKRKGPILGNLGPFASHPQVFVSSPCGLAGWTEEEMENTFSRLQG